MRLFAVENWLRSPADRDIIVRWTQDGQAGAAPDVPADAYTLELPPGLAPEDGTPWEFLALGDTGDADAAGPGVAPQDAVGQNLALDAIAPVGKGDGRFVMHTGDVVYMTGERRLYDRNFRRPYAPFLAESSTVGDLCFKLPFLPVPGNHDYYDLGAWATLLGRVPILGAGLRAIAHELFAFKVPEGGSDMGRAYMEAFVDLSRNGSGPAPLPYAPGEKTRLPNRYYQFRLGGVDFFALDSNTLDAPPPEVGMGQAKRDAAARVEQLEERARELDRELARLQRERDQWRKERRREAAADAARLGAAAENVAKVTDLLARLRARLAGAAGKGDPLAAAVGRAERRWTEGAGDLAGAAGDPGKAEDALNALDDASDDACAALRDLDHLLAALPQASPERGELLGIKTEIDRALADFAVKVTPPPADLDARLRALSEEALDVQRELALERRRLRYRPEDHDRAQLAWLDTALSRSRAERPGAWRIVWLHHPLYTTIGNHAERADVVGLRENLLAILRAHAVDAVFSGHSHAFEWFRSDALPGAGLFVSGGGGQITLRPSLLDPARLRRRRDRYESLVGAGAVECAAAGVGPGAGDGEGGPLYHYLRVRVAPDALTITPVGVRRLSTGAFRREEPMPAFHAAALPAGPAPGFRPRRLRSVTVRRNNAGVTAEWDG